MATVDPNAANKQRLRRNMQRLKKQQGSSGTTIPFTAKGDLVTFDGSDIAVLPVGSNDQVLTADSAQPTGLTWRLPHPLTTKGDIFVYGTGGVTRLPVGSDLTRLIADSSQATGLRWGTILTAKGSLLVGDGTANDNHLDVSGVDGRVLIEDSTQTVGLRWGTLSSSTGSALYEELGTVDQGDIMGASSIAQNTFTKSTGTVIGYTFPANSLTAGGLYRLTVYCNLAVGGSTTLTMRAYFGNQGTLLWTSGALSVATSSTGFRLALIFRVVTTGSSGTVRFSGDGAAHQTSPTFAFNNSLPTVNTTTTNQLTLSQQFANSSAGNQIRVCQYFLERLV